MIPKVGSVILIPPSDDHCGGKAIVSEVKDGISAGQPAIFVEVEQCNSSYNWEFLEQQQSKLNERYGDRWAYSDYPRNLAQYSLEELQEEINKRLKAHGNF